MSHPLALPPTRRPWSRTRFAAAVAGLVALLVAGAAAPSFADNDDTLATSLTAQNTSIYTGENLVYSAQLSCSEPTQCVGVNVHLSKPDGVSGTAILPGSLPPGITTATANADGSVDLVYTATAAGLTTQLNVSWPTANYVTPAGPSTTTMTVTGPGLSIPPTTATIERKAGTTTKLTKTGQAAEWLPNTVFKYKVRLDLGGADPASLGHGVDGPKILTLVDQLPAGATFVSMDPTPAGMVYDPGANTLTWTYKDMATPYTGWDIAVTFKDSAVGTSPVNNVTMSGKNNNGDPLTGSANATVNIKNLAPTYAVRAIKVGNTMYDGQWFQWMIGGANNSNVAGAVVFDDDVPASNPVSYVYQQDATFGTKHPGSDVTFTYADGTSDTVPFNPGTAWSDHTNVPAGRPLVTHVQVRITNVQPGETAWFFLNGYVDGSKVPAGATTIRNCVDVSMGDAKATQCSNTGYSPVATPAMGITKTNVTNKPVAPGGTITFELGLNSTSTLAWMPDLYDTMPNELIYTPGSLRGVAANPPSCPAGSDFTETVTPGWTGGFNTGVAHTLVRWTYQGSTGVKNATCAYRYDTTVKPGVADGTYTGGVGDGDYPGNRVWGFDRDVRIPDDTNNRNADLFDVNGNKDTIEYTVMAGAAFSVDTSTAAWIEKEVRGDQDSSAWIDSAEKNGNSVATNHGTSTIGGSVDWKVRMGNIGNKPITNLVAYDLLPLPGNHGVTNGRYYGVPSTGSNAWTPTMTKAIDTSALPAGTKVTYSVNPDPCRPEMDNNPAHTVAFYCNGNQDPSWQTAGQVTDWSKVRSIRFDYGAYVFAPGAYFDVAWSMAAPTSLADGSAIKGGEATWNKVAVSAARADTGDKLLAAEAPWVVDIMKPPPAPPKTFAIGDYTWIDENGNGVQDSGELPISGVKVDLLDLDGNVLQSTTTDSNGYYHFDELAAGKYVVAFGEVDGYTRTIAGAGSDTKVDSNADQSSGKSAVITLGEGEDNVTDSIVSDKVTAPLINRTIDAGYVPPATTYAIGDFTWIDANRDGVQDPGETPISGVPVTLYAQDGTTALGSTTSDADGWYHFDGLPAGKYIVGFGDVAGYTRTVKGAGSDDTLDSNADVTTGRTAVVDLGKGLGNTTPSQASDNVTAPFIDRTVDAGYSPLTYAIGHYTWIDSNRNGIQDPGERPIGGVEVKLLDADGNLLRITTTGPDGWYEFDGLAAGTYLVQFGAVPGYTRTTAAVGTDPGVDSDGNVSTGLSALIELGQGRGHTTPSTPSDRVAAQYIDRTIDEGYVLTSTTALVLPAAPSTDPDPSPSPAVVTQVLAKAEPAFTGSDVAGTGALALVLTLGGGSALFAARRHPRGKHCA